jgi:hypothetical protein
MVYKSDAPTVDPATIQIDIPGVESGAEPAIEIPGMDKGVDGAKDGATGDSGKSGDPLQDMLKQQEDESEQANKALEDALKAK